MIVFWIRSLFRNIKPKSKKVAITRTYFLHFAVLGLCMLFYAISILFEYCSMSVGKILNAQSTKQLFLIICCEMTISWLLLPGNCIEVDEDNMQEMEASEFLADHGRQCLAALSQIHLKKNAQIRLQLALHLRSYWLKSCNFSLSNLCCSLWYHFWLIVLCAISFG
jgi:hypothetical protein